MSQVGGVGAASPPSRRKRSSLVAPMNTNVVSEQPISARSFEEGPTGRGGLFSRVEEAQSVEVGGCCALFRHAIEMFCFLGCPPVPEIITRKIAFHPPPKRQSYRLMGISEDGTTMEIEDLDRLPKLRELWIHPVLPRDLNINMVHYMWLRKSAKTFVLQSEHGNQLLTIWVSNPSALKKNMVILFCQGNSSDLGFLIHPNRESLLAMSVYFAVDVVCCDYSGFGYSTGFPSEENIYADTRAMYDFIRQERGEDVEIILMGYSMGTAASIDLASRRPPNLVGVVLIAPFTSGIRVLRRQPEKLKTSFLDRFRSIDKVSSINVPTLLIHGKRDRVVPIEHSYALYRRLARPVHPLYIRKGDHFQVLGVQHIAVAQRISHFVAFETAAAMDTSSSSTASGRSKPLNKNSPQAPGCA